MEKLKKVLIITYYWPPSGGAGVQRTLKFAKYLPEFGIEPIVLTVDDKIASYPVRDESLSKEIPQGLRVYRTSSFEPLNILASIGGKGKVPYGGFSNTSKDSLSQKMLRWVRGNFFIPDARVGWVKHAVQRAAELIRLEKIDTIYISSPPHSSQLIGLKLRKMFPQLRWIADLRDPWTSIYYYKELLHTSIAAGKDKKFENQVLQQCDHAIVVSNSIRNDLAKQNNVSVSKFSVIPNGYDTFDFDYSITTPKDKFVINYTGTLADSYNPANVVAAIGAFVKMGGKENIRLRFVGAMPASVKQLLSDNDLESSCEFISYVPHLEATGFMQSGHVNLLIIPDSVGAEGILTGKLFEYLGAGRLILGIGPVNGDAATIVRECGTGQFFSRDQEQEMTNWLMDQYVKFKSGISLDVRSEIRNKYQRRELTAALALILKKYSDL